MNFQLLDTYINIMIFLFIIFRIITWRRFSSPHKPFFSWVAWLLCMCSLIIIICLILGHYKIAEWAETVINLTLCISLYYSDGNVANLFKVKK